MRLLGTIVRLQYQRDHLKVPGPFGKRYDPISIVPVDELRLTPEGVLAGDPDDPQLDVHHKQHDRSRNRGDNGISIGFTGHYTAMRNRLGDRVVDGIAGENILIDYEGVLKPADVRGGLVVETANGPVSIERIKIATPCVEFSRFAMDFPENEAPDTRVTETLVFLNGGMRGFYASVDAEATFRAGDRVFFRD